MRGWSLCVRRSTASFSSTVAGLGVGQLIDVGTPLVTVKNPRVDTSRCQCRARTAQGRRGRTAGAVFKAGEHESHARCPALAAFRVSPTIALRQIEAELPQAGRSDRFGRSRTEQGGRRFACVTASSPAQAPLAAATMDDADRDVLVAKAKVDEAEASRAVLAVELAALKNGSYLGDDYNDQPRSAQRIDELDQSDCGARGRHCPPQPADRAAASPHCRDRRSAGAGQRGAPWPHRSAVRVWEVLTAARRTGGSWTATFQPAELLRTRLSRPGQRGRLQQPQRRHARDLHLSRRRRGDGRQGGATERRCLGIVELRHHARPPRPRSPIGSRYRLDGLASERLHARSAARAASSSSRRTDRDIARDGDTQDEPDPTPCSLEGHCTGHAGCRRTSSFCCCMDQARELLARLPIAIVLALTLHYLCSGG